MRPARSGDAGPWNDFVAASPGGSPLALYQWRDVLEASYGLATTFLIAVRGSKTIGIAGGYESRGGVAARDFYSLRCGLLATDGEAAAALLDALKRTGETRGWSGMLLTSGWAALPGAAPLLTRQTVQLGLDSEEDRMWRGLRDKTRNMIRRAEKEGVEVRSGLEHVDVLADHYRANMLRMGLPIHSRRYFHEIAGRLAPWTEILVARHEGKDIASMMLHMAGETACFPVQNALHHYRKLAAVQCLNWAAMKLCAARGMRLLDMGESREGSPVFRSKRNFGGVAREVFYYGRRPVPAAGVMARATAVAEGWLASRAPLPVRRPLAERRLLRGRLV